MALQIKLPVFEGPLDFLLYLLDKDKISIYDIPIVSITEQYMAYLEELQTKDLNVMSEFLLMAATLLDIKAKMLLPTEEEEEEEDPREALVQQLLEYKMYKSASKDLRAKMAQAQKALFKPPSIPQEVLEYEQPVEVEKLLSGVSLSQLEAVFQSILRKKEERIDPVRSRFGRIEREEVSLEDTIAYVEDYVASRGQANFQMLLETGSSRMEVIVTFLAILELMKMGKIIIFQESISEDILLQWKEV
jgi:segregation and condensation protein A